MKNFLLKYIYPIPIYYYIIIPISAVLWHIAVDIYSINSYVVNTSITDTPEREYALVLGSSKILPNGGLNLYYAGRIDTCAKLYKANKIKKIILSGDNSREDYNEPQMMKDDLIAQGVPADVILLDGAGLRTLDSVVHCKNIFKCEDPMIITQHYHAKRALYLCNANNMKGAIAFEAPADVPFFYIVRNNVREALAWVKAWIDINFSNN